MSKLETKCAIYMLLLELPYGYKIFNGRRELTRIILLCFAILFRLTVGEIQQLLKMRQKQELCPKIRFDVVIIYGIEHQYSIEEIEESAQDMNKEKDSKQK